MLTDIAIRKERPAIRPRKLFDGGGMYLLLNPDGTRWWRLKYRIEGREKLLSLGVYPEITLKRARERRDEARRLIAVFSSRISRWWPAMFKIPVRWVQSASNAAYAAASACTVSRIAAVTGTDGRLLPRVR
ncbi:MAG TPA: Arm DNA-binding domain-containing protein [Steroidobacteraceae bacterium]|jgi:hypothetical protein